MKVIRARLSIGVFACIVVFGAMVAVSPAEDSSPAPGASPEAQVLRRLGEIQKAAEALDAEKVFSFVLENDKGALVQNGRLLLTRAEALESTRRGFQGLQKVSYQLSKEHVSMLSPTIALVVADGSSTATTKDGQEFTTAFTQSVVFLLTNGEWKVFHAHRSFPAPR